jgi:small GTP-binding protein
MRDIYSGCDTVVHVFDTAGQEQFRSIVPMYFRGAGIVLLVFDLTSRESFVHIPQWNAMVLDSAPQDICRILIANKSDLIDDRQVTDDEIEDTRANLGIETAFTTSAITGSGIDSLKMWIFSTESIPRSVAVRNEFPGQEPSDQVQCCKF